MASQPHTGSARFTAAMSRYTSQITRLETLIRSPPPAGARSGGGPPTARAKAINGILEAHDLMIRRLGRWPDGMIWSPDPVTALHAARGQLQETLATLARGQPASNQLAWLDLITAALDGMCAELAAQGELLVNPAHAHPADPCRPVCPRLVWE
jgi:hypothetical protein